MSYRWGAVDVPELSYQPRRLRERLAPGEFRGVTRDPTGLRMATTNARFETRGEGLDYLFLGPPEDSWVARETVGRTFPDLTGRLLKHLGIGWKDFTAIPSEDRQALEVGFLRLHGDSFECLAIEREGDSPPVVWSAVRRDAFVLMILFFLEMSRHDAGPFPSTLSLRTPGIPAALQGTFKNPVWERLQ